nr:Shedu immune nuclease family protein [Rhodococcus sp. MS16]
MVYSLGRHPVTKILTKAADGVTELTEGEQDELIETFAAESTALARTRPEAFLKLHRDVELVNLDRLIEAYEESLAGSTVELDWQIFFDNNVFALQQVFGTPMVSFQSTASVGGVGFSGSGGKIADFLYKNPMTNNAALVELKRPSTPLLAPKKYRGGVFRPSNDLAGAVTQVMDQAYQLMTSFAQLRFSSRSDLEAYAVQCFVIAGRTASLDHPDKQKSFEMYRANSRSVKIVTYDEILEQLKFLRNFLSGETEEDSDDLSS